MLKCGLRYVEELGNEVKATVHPIAESCSCSDESEDMMHVVKLDFKTRNLQGVACDVNEATRVFSYCSAMLGKGNCSLLKDRDTT